MAEIIIAILIGAVVGLIVSRMQLDAAQRRHEQIMAILDREDDWYYGPDFEGMRNRMAGHPANPKPDSPRPKQETREE